MPSRYSQKVVAAILKKMALVTTYFPTRLPDNKLPNKRPKDRENDKFKIEAQSHKQYQESKWYGRIVSLLLDGEKRLNECGQTKKQAVRKTALKYQIAGRYLVHLD